MLQLHAFSIDYNIEITDLEELGQVVEEQKKKEHTVVLNLMHRKFSERRPERGKRG